MGVTVTSPHAMGADILLFYVLGDTSHKGHLPCISSSSLELFKDDCLCLRHSPGFAVPNGDGMASVPRALNHWVTCVEIANIGIVYNTRLTLDDSTGQGFMQDQIIASHMFWFANHMFWWTRGC